MNEFDGHTIIAKDALEEILREKLYGKKLLNRIRKNEFGVPVYIANVTVSSIIHDNVNDEEFPKIIRNMGKLFLKAMPFDKPGKRAPLFQDIHVSHTPWESARRWYIQAAIRKILLEGSLQKMDMLVWCDIALIEANKQIDQIITKGNPYYDIIKRLSRQDKRFPKFFIKN